MLEAGLLQGRTSLYDIENTSLVHHVNQALRANMLFQRDIDYIVKDGKVIIIDEFTGRMMDGRASPMGFTRRLRQKKASRSSRKPDAGVDHFPELFPHVSQAFRHDRNGSDRSDRIRGIYELEVIAIPTNMPVSRKDEDDDVYRTAGKIRRHDWPN